MMDLSSLGNQKEMLSLTSLINSALQTAGCDERISETLGREKTAVGCWDLIEEKMSLLDLVLDDAYGSGHDHITIAQKRIRWNEYQPARHAEVFTDDTPRVFHPRRRV